MCVFFNGSFLRRNVLAKGRRQAFPSQQNTLPFRTVSRPGNGFRRRLYPITLNHCGIHGAMFRRSAQAFCTCVLTRLRTSRKPLQLLSSLTASPQPGKQSVPLPDCPPTSQWIPEPTTLNMDTDLLVDQTGALFMLQSPFFPIRPSGMACSHRIRRAACTRGGRHVGRRCRNFHLQKRCQRTHPGTNLRKNSVSRADRNSAPHICGQHCL